MKTVCFDFDGHWKGIVDSVFDFETWFEKIRVKNTPYNREDKVIMTFVDS